MVYQNRSYWGLALIIGLGLMLLASGGCNNSSSSSGPSGLPPDPGVGNLAGIVHGTVGGQPLAGVTVSAKGITTTTDAAGIFQLNGVGEGALGVAITGNTVYSRTAAVNTANGRSVRLDAIETNSSFNLAFYREIARGNDPAEQYLLPNGKVLQTHRWTNLTPPTFIIDTNASSTLAGVISSDQINTVREVLATIIPVFTAGFYASPTVITQSFSQINLDWIPDNSFVITFDDSLINSGAYGETVTAPDFTSPATGTINKTIVVLVARSQFYQEITFQEVIAHESGHGFGFRHTSNILPSVMVRLGAFGGLYSTADQLHMKVMYSRPAGNTDIDNDPVPGGKLMGEPLGGVQVFIDRRANVSLSPELRERIRALPSKLPRDLLQQAME